MAAIGRLHGKTIAVPESRQLDIMARLLENRGARVLRVPMVAIHDAPDPAPVLAWVRNFIDSPPDEFIILTGEGLRRLLALAQRHEIGEEFISAFAGVCKLCRGPKPERALREMGLKGDLAAQAPTTEGVIATLEGRALEGHRVAVQLYGEDPNTRLINYLHDRRAEIRAVAPYVYADRSEEDQVMRLVRALAAGEIDVIAFTSQAQYLRLSRVAAAHHLEEDLAAGLSRCTVAAVGPVVRDQLEQAGVTVQVMPQRAFFMKPLVSAIVNYFDGD